MFFSFKDLCSWQRSINSWSPKDVVIQSYCLNRVWWLALWLAEPSTRLNYKLVWASGTARSIMLGVWCASLLFERKEAQRVQIKVEIFEDFSTDQPEKYAYQGANSFIELC